MVVYISDRVWGRMAFYTATYPGGVAVGNSWPVSVAYMYVVRLTAEGVPMFNMYVLLFSLLSESLPR